MNNLKRINTIYNIYSKFGYLSLGEPMSQTEHALYSYYCMKNHDNRSSLQLASLLHDIGHYIFYDNRHKIFKIGAPLLLENNKHEIMGSVFLKSLGFPKRVYIPVEYHVDAKRYLATTEKLHYLSLTNASKLSLNLQGGRMSEVEMNSFKKTKYFQESLLLRKCDDNSKLYIRNYNTTDLNKAFLQILTELIPKTIKE